MRTQLALERWLAERGYPYRSLVAFSGAVEDGGQTYTEASLNGFSDRQTAATFQQPEYRFLVVANKFQTGFDQPLLHTMYVDKKLGGVNAVQTLSRLNRRAPGKDGTLVLYTLQGRLAAIPFYTEAEVTAFAALRLDPKTRQDRLQADPALEAASRANTRENVRLTFDSKVEQVIQDIVDSNFDLYKRINDDRAFGEALKGALFEVYLRGKAA